MSQSRRKTTTANAGRTGDTPLDAKQRAVAEQEEKLRTQMKKFESLIENAPKLAKERDRVRREQFVQRASRTQQARPRSLPDARYEVDAATPARQRQLRAERNRGRSMFFFLLVVFAATMVWLYFTVLQQQ